MTKEEKLEAIYKEIANKELTTWCSIRVISHYMLPDSYTKIDSSTENRVLKRNERIIWHPVLISTVEYKLNAEDYIEVRKLISREELIKPVEEWNSIAIDKLYEKVLHIWCKTV